MKTNPMQLVILCTAGFAALILLQVLAQYRSSEEFRQHMQKLSVTDLLPKIRAQRVAEENMDAVPSLVPSTDLEIEDDDDTEEG